MPRRPVKRISLAGPYAAMTALGNASFQPEFNQEALQYQRPTFGQNFITGGRAGQTVSGYNQQILMDQLRQQDAFAKAKALEDLKQQQALAEEQRIRGDIGAQYGANNLTQPIFDPWNKKILDPEKLRADTSSNQVLNKQNLATLPEAGNAAIAKQGAETLANQLAGVKSKQALNTHIDLPGIIPGMIQSEAQKAQIANVGNLLENVVKSKQAESQYFPIGGQFLGGPNNRLFGPVAGEAGKPYSLDTGGNMIPVPTPPTPKTVQEIPNPLAPTGQTPVGQGQKKIITAKDLPARGPNETIEQHIQKLKLLFPEDQYEFQ